MSKKTELVKNTGILLIGKICTQFISFLLVPLYTAVLTTSEYGIVDLVLTYLGLLIPVISLQLESSLFRFLIDVRDNSHEKKKIISNCYIFVFVTTIISSIIMLILCSLFNFQYTYYLLLMLFVTTFSSLSLQLCRGLGDNVGYAIGSIISGGVNILCNVLFLVVFHLGIEGMFLSQIISNILCVIFLIFRTDLFSYLKWESLEKNTLKKVLAYSIPLVPNGVIWWVINASDRTLIAIFINTGANGIYAIANKFSAILTNLYNVYNMSLTENISLYIKEKGDYVNDVLNSSFKFFSTLIFGFIACMPFIFFIMIDSSFYEAYKYIPILLLSTLFNIYASMLGTIYIATKSTKKIAMTSLFAGITNILINLIFIKKIGLYAASISTLISFMVMVIYRYFDVKKYISIKVDLKYLCYFILEATVILITYYSKNIIFILFGILLSGISFIIINRNMVLFISEKIKRKFNYKGKFL